MAKTVPLNDNQKLQQAAFGTQNLLVLVAVPATAPGSLVGKALVDAGALTVAGTYDCLIPLSGIVNKIECHLTATIAAGTASSALNTTYFISNAAVPSMWTAKTAGTGAGSLTTASLQTSSISTLAGEQYAWLRITLASSPNVTFTVAEYNGC